MGNAAKVKLIAFDVDGTLTNGTLVIGTEETVKLFNAKDGLGIACAERLGYVVGFITGRVSDPVSKRADELSLDFNFMGISNKVEAMEELLDHYHLTWEEAAYMGDDLNDLPLIHRVGFSASPKDGAEEVKKAASFVTKAKGGRGAAREFIEKILKDQGRWEEAVRSYEGSDKVLQ